MFYGFQSRAFPFVVTIKQHTLMKIKLLPSVFITALLLTLYSCGTNTEDKKLFSHNKTGIIVAMNGYDTSFTPDVYVLDDAVEYWSGPKYPKPTICATVLVQDLEDTTQFFELPTCNNGKPALINKDWYYNHKVGDSVHFEYIRKDRYFKIEPRPVTLNLDSNTISGLAGPYLYSEKLTFYPASHELSPQDTVILYNLIDILQKDTSKYTQICGYIDTSEHPSDYRRSCLSYDRGWNVAHHLMRRGISRDRIEVWISTGAPSSIKRMRIEIAQR